MSSLPPVVRFNTNTGVRIYRIPCQVLDYLSARVYLILGAGPPTLLDAGSGQGNSTRHILDGLAVVREEFGEPMLPEDIERIIITHGHIDHVFGLPEILRYTPKAKVAVHPLDVHTVTSCRQHRVLGARRLDDFLRRSGVDPQGRERLIEDSPFRHKLGVEDVAVEWLLKDGDDIDGMRIIHTPGHTPGHICIQIGNILLSGDHILSQTLCQQWPESMAAYAGLGRYLESLDKIARTPGIELTLASHERKIQDVYGRIETIRLSQQRRLARLLEMVRKLHHPLSMAEITAQLYPEMTGFRAVLAFADVGARVEYLHQHGMLRIVNLDDIERIGDVVYRYTVA